MIKNRQLCSDVTVVIRAAGERTEALCEQLALQQVPHEHVVVIHERPFTTALRTSYELGLDGGLLWTLCLDADVLLCETAIPRLLALADELGKDALGVQPRILDKFFGGPRPAGVHLYRTCLLNEARTLVLEVGQTLRPETHVMKQMAARGHDHVPATDVVALHDFEQFYRDIYRKTFVHAHKHRRYVSHLGRLWQRLAAEDPDYQVAVWGLRAGRIFDGPLQLDVRCFPQEIDALLRMQGWQEKGDLSPTALMALDIGQLIDTFVPLPEYWSCRHLMDASVDCAQATGWRMRFAAVLKKTGWIGIGPWLVGRSLRHIGQKLQAWGEKRVATERA